MSVFYLGFISLYSFLLLIMKRKWEKEEQFFPYPQENKLKIALLIPYRNERVRLPGLLPNVLAVSRSTSEVILVNDHSDDGSQDIVREFIDAHHLKLWRMMDHAGSGKKSALTTALNATDAEIIVTTDADCLLPDNWLPAICKHFVRDSVQMVAGSVMTVTGKGFFSSFQQIEWASILLVMRYAFSVNKPLTVSGANLAYRRSAFRTVRGYEGNETHLSGDDEFLLKKIVKKYGPGALVFTKRRECLVWTFPFVGVRDLLIQRIRWASKWKLHRSFYHAGTAFGGLLVAIVQLSSFLLMLGALWDIVVFLAFWVIKVVVERNVLGRILSEYGIGGTGWAYLKTSCIHPFYSVWIGIFSIRGKFIWKGRKNDFHL